MNQRRRSPGDFTPDDAIVCHLYGRFCNASKFAGEVDLFEALDSIRKRYPIDESDRRMADLSGDHPQLIEDYRAAHRIYLAQGDGDVDTEEHREAFVHYRALFDRLLGTGSDVNTQVQNGEHRRQAHDHA